MFSDRGPKVPKTAAVYRIKLPCGIKQSSDAKVIPVLIVTDVVLLGFLSILLM